MPADTRRTLCLTSAIRHAIRSSQELVQIGCLSLDHTLPLLVECRSEPLDLQKWGTENDSLITASLYKHGAVLFRGFSALGPCGLKRLAEALGTELMDYMEGATPRKNLGNGVYTSTEFPADRVIALHNENSYVTRWPMKLFFACVIAPVDRGETPIGDVRKVLERIDPKIRHRFERKGYMLVRNFTDHIGLPWKVSFKVSNKQELVAYCATSRIAAEWVSENHLRTRQVRRAIVEHPHTHEKVWFNHIAFWHVSSLESGLRESLLSMSSGQDLPYNTYYGDGAQIEDDVVEEIRKAYEAETVKFRWNEGDVLLVDNMLVAHGRSAFSCPRQIVVSMGEPYGLPNES
jgi:alpha-ketoglutarate-dependent taurine dioxygenase